MQKHRTVQAAILAVVAAVAFTGCSSGSTAPKAVAVGEAINFTTNSGAGVSMTIDKIADPADPTDPVIGTIQPPAGYRLVAIEVRVVNNSPSTYTDDLGNATLIDSRGFSYSPKQVLPEIVDNLDKTSESSDIPSGATAIGAVVFQVPVNFKVATVQLVADHGTGQKGQWKAA